MFRSRSKRIGVGIGCALLTTVMVAIVYRYTGAPLAFVLLVPIFVASFLGGREGGTAALLPSLIAVYYFTEPVGWRLTASGAVSITLFAVASSAIIAVISKMQNAISAREALLSLVSHDLKTPLSTMRLREQQLIRKLRTGSAPSADELQAHSEAAVQLNDHLTLIINNLLSLGRIQSGRFRLQQTEADLVPSLIAVIERLDPEFDARGLTLSIKGMETPCMGCWDLLVIAQVLMNLLSNAIKYGNGQPVDVMLEQETSRVRLVVADRGIGIAPQEQRLVFESFEKAAGGYRQAHSHGLGLWIVRELVEAHGGRVALDSKPGEGTTVTVALPRWPKTPVFGFVRRVPVPSHQ
jgi:signal transduction histidine kinase